MHQKISVYSLLIIAFARVFGFKNEQRIIHSGLYILKQNRLSKFTKMKADKKIFNKASKNLIRFKLKIEQI